MHAPPPSSGVGHQRKHQPAGHALRPAAGAGPAYDGPGGVRYASDKRWRPEIGEDIIRMTRKVDYLSPAKVIARAVARAVAAVSVVYW